MKLYQQRQIKEALAESENGGQALHLFDNAFVGPNAPACFKRSPICGHLYDQDENRLLKTARRLGVRVVFIHHQGRTDQHVDLCGKPLAKAVTQNTALASEPSCLRGE